MGLEIRVVGNDSGEKVCIVEMVSYLLKGIIWCHNNKRDSNTMPIENFINFFF